MRAKSVSAPFAERRSVAELLESRVFLSAAGLVGYWKLDDASGVAAVDSSGNGNNGTLAGAPVWTTGKVNGALSLSGTTDRVVVADNDSLDTGSAITLSEWVRPGQLATQYPLKKAANSATDGYELGLSSTGKVFVRFNQFTSGDTFRVDSVTSYPTNNATWMHVAATYDGATIKLYINGTLEASKAATFTIAANSLGLGIGAEASGFRAIKGGVDEVKVFNRALSSAEVLDLTNLPPTVNAGTDQSVTLPNGATLSGVVTDDALPNPPGAPTTLWSQVSGPGSVTFGDATATNTTATFSQAGTYVLQLAGDDGEQLVADNLTVQVVDGASNQAPQVDAGSDQTITLPAQAALDGTVTDDSLPNPPGAVNSTWSEISGPGTATFVNPAAVDTTASFSQPGTYVLQLAANDGALTSTATKTVNVNPANISTQSLQQLSISANTGEKPQSKLWEYNNTWFAVLPNSSGTWLWRLGGTTWSSLLKLSTKTNVHADVKAVGNITHVLLYNGAGTNANAFGEQSGYAAQLVSLEYVASSNSYTKWSARTSTVNVPLSQGVETATIDIDSTGRMWMAQDTNNSVIVRYSDSTYGTWSAPITIATGVGSDDISVVKAMPGGKIGVFWSNQVTQRFGFRTHIDGTSPSTWTANELPASQSALNVGHGMADDHMNLAVASDGTLYAAVKTSYDTAGYTTMALLVRRPNGAWDNLYQVDTVGTRPVVLLNEAEGTLTVIYTASANGGDNILYKRSPISNISFGSRRTLIAGSYNNVTTTKQNVTDDAVVLVSGGSPLKAAGVRITFQLPANNAAARRLASTSVSGSTAPANSIIASSTAPGSTSSSTAFAPLVSLKSTSIGSSSLADDVDQAPATVDLIDPRGLRKRRFSEVRIGCGV